VQKILQVLELGVKTDETQQVSAEAKSTIELTQPLVNDKSAKSKKVLASDVMITKKNAQQVSDEGNLTV